MSFTRRYRTIVWLEPDAALADVELVRWLARESFDRKAADEFLTLVEYNESPLPADEVPPKLAELLGRPVSDFNWLEFTGVARAESV